MNYKMLLNVPKLKKVIHLLNCYFYLVNQLQQFFDPITFLIKHFFVFVKLDPLIRKGQYEFE